MQNTRFVDEYTKYTNIQNIQIYKNKHEYKLQKPSKINIIHHNRQSKLNYQKLIKTEIQRAAMVPTPNINANIFNISCKKEI